MLDISCVCIVDVGVGFWCAKLPNNILINYQLVSLSHIHTGSCVLRSRMETCLFSQWNLIAFFFGLSNFGCFHSINFFWWIDLTCIRATTWIPLHFLSITKPKLVVSSLSSLSIGGQKCWCQLTLLIFLPHLR